jgi:hypothetical protein
MFVIAHHFIQEPEEFWSLAQQVNSSIPTSLKLHSVFPSRDLKTGTCIWEADNAGEVQTFLDKMTGKTAKNVCYEVREEMAINLPQKTIKEAVA